jgi:uncharacterized protein YdeI (YjbR/CyaY-like superfamily)
MSSAKPKIFRARLEPLGNALNWTIARVPFDMAKVWPERRGRRVRGTINGFAFRTSLMPALEGGRLVLLVNKKMQAGARARLGDTVTIHLEPDMEEREATVPAEFARILRQEADLRKWFQSLSPSDRRWVAWFVGEAKSAASRQKRAEQMAERLMLAMEGEVETPPVLKAAFQRQPLAERGWQAMTAVQRRRHLLGIFYYRSPEARQRRVQQAIDQAVSLARRKALATGTAYPEES